MKNKNIYLIYAYTFFSTFILYYICDTLFFLERGLSSNLYILFPTITFLVRILFEIPSGIIADRYSKKKILLLGNILFIISTIIFIASKTFFVFVIAVVIDAIRNALLTGIVNSLLYEQIENKREFGKYLFKKDFFYNLSYMLAMIIGGYIGQKISLVATYYISIIPFIICFILLLFFKEDKSQKRKYEHNIKISVFKNAIYEIKNSNIIINLIFIFSVLFSIIKLVEESHPEYAANIGIPIFWIGIYTAFILVFCIIGSYSGSIIKKKYKYIIVLNPIICGFCIFLLGLLNNVVGIFFLLIMYIFSESFENISLNIIHNKISSQSRVTVESIISIVYSIIGLAFGISMSFILNFLTLPMVYIILGIILIFVGFINALKLKKKYLKNI